MCFPVKRNMLSFGTQATSAVNLTEGYLCMHSQTISLQTVKCYSTSQCGQDRDEFTEITKVSTRCISVSIFLLLLFCDYTMYIYIFSLSMFVFLWVCVIRPAQLVFFNILNKNPPGEVSRFPT